MIETILIVDDEAAIRKLLRCILEDDSSYKILEAVNGVQALEVLKKEKVDLVILDLMMPIMGGFETLKNIRANLSLNSIPIIIISAISRMSDMEECLKLGVADYFSKPLSQDDIRLFLPLKVRNLIKLKLTQEKLVQSEKMASIGGLAAGMAHEINNPLGGILQNLQLIEKRFDFTSPKNKEKLTSLGFDEAQIEKLSEYLNDSKVNKYITFIRDAGTRAAQIVRTLLDFSRSREDKKFKLSELNAMVEHAVELALTEYHISTHYDFKNIEIIKDYAVETKPVRCDPQEIEQVVFNLIKNASYELHKLKSKDSNFNPVIKLKTHFTATTGIIEINDNGKGIDEGNTNNIFEPFFTTKEVGEGLGLGLSISYFIVKDLHGGNLRFESKPDKGTSFFIELPL